MAIYTDYEFSAASCGAHQVMVCSVVMDSEEFIKVFINKYILH